MPGKIGMERFTYETAEGWEKIPEGYEFPDASGVTVDSDDNVYILNRGAHPVIVLDKDGNFLRSFGEGEFDQRAHGIHCSPDNFIYTVNDSQHCIKKYTREGKLLMVIGEENKAAEKWSGTPFHRPTNMAVSPNTGDIFVTDGYGNSRVMKFDSKGKYLSQWGKPGKGQGEFDTPHAILVDRKGRVVVGDRENDRVQVFDANGKWLATWPGFAPFGLVEDSKGAIFVADGRANQVLQVDPTSGKVTSRWGSQGTGPGQYQLPHMLAVDKQGSLYVVEIQGKRLQKLRR